MHRTSKAVWKGTLTEGQGTLDTQSGAIADLPYSFKGRFQDESGQSGTNPGDLADKAKASCPVSGALSSIDIRLDARLA